MQQDLSVKRRVISHRNDDVNRRFMRSLMKKFLSIVTLVSLMSGIFGIQNILAAPLVFVSDAVTSHVISAASDHVIVFTTPSGVQSPSDTIDIVLSQFDLSAITASDIALLHGPSTGLETTESLSNTAGLGIWGVAISGSTITFTPPTNAGVNEIATNDIVRIRIGLIAGGTHQIINPSTPNSYQGYIRGAFGDTGSFGLVVMANDQVVVTANVQAPSQGGHGQPSVDTVAPIIVNVISTSTSPTSVTIQWISNEPSTSAVDFGLTTMYASGTVSDASQIYQHSVSITDLSPCTKYYYQVRSTDASGNQGESSGYSFITLCDSTPPIISNVRVDQVTDSQAVILWSTNEPATSRVEYGVGAVYTIFSEGSGYATLHSLPVSGLTPNTVYNYRVVSTDVSGNTAVSSGWVFVTNHDITPPTNVMLTATPGDTLVVLHWTTPLESDVAGVRIVRRADRFPMSAGDGDLVYAGLLTDLADQGLSNDTTYYYGAFVYDTAGNYSSGALASATPRKGIIPPEIPPEIPPGTTTTPPVVQPPIIPPGEVTSTPPVIPGEPTIGATASFEFLGSNGTLPLAIDEHGVIGVRGNSAVTVRVPVSSLNGVPRYAVVIVGGFIIQLQLNRVQGYYEGTFSVSPNVIVNARGQVLFADGRVAERRFEFKGYSSGAIVQTPLYGTGMMPVPSAEVKLYREELGKWVLWNSAPYGQLNPQMTSTNGSYLFEVPVGRYYAEVYKNGYELRKTNPIQVTRNIFNERIELIYIPKTLRELLESTSSTGALDRVGIVARSVLDGAVYQLKKLRVLLSNKDVQDVNTQIIAPSALIISAFNAMTVASVFQWLTYLQYIFTQPLLIVWRRKRTRYGVIYNSLTKRPLDLCIVRLIHADTDLIVQTCVTDKQGRYVFHVKPGVYRLDILKPRYVYPSEFVKEAKTDDEYLDVYDGGEIHVQDDGTVALNVPIDPLMKMQTPTHVRVRIVLRKAQHLVAHVSIVASVLGLIVTPTVPMALGVVSQFVIYSLFKRLMIPDAPKRWGFVYDAKTLKPISNAIVRLYDQKYRRLLESQMTNSKGQYGFLVGKNEYLLTIESKGYQLATVEHVDLKTKADSAVDIVVSMRKEVDKSAGKSPLVK